MMQSDSATDRTLYRLVAEAVVVDLLVKDALSSSSPNGLSWLDMVVSSRGYTDDAVLCSDGTDDGFT